MARARNIKPSLFKNEILGVEDIALTLLFEGLWCLADREGRLEDRPMRIKAELFPYRDNNNINGENTCVNGYLTQLEQLGFIERYEVDDQKIIQVVNFSKHQRPHNTEKASVLPDRAVDKGSQELTVNTTLNNGESKKRNALIPDSLNTDSGYLNDDHHENGVSTEKPSSSSEKPWVVFENRLAAIGHDPIRLVNHRNQFKVWHDDGVTMPELNAAIEASQQSLGNKGNSEPPPVKYIATVIASNRKQSDPVSAGAKEINTHTGLDKKDFSREKASGKFKNVVGGNQ